MLARYKAFSFPIERIWIDLCLSTITMQQHHKKTPHKTCIKSSLVCLRQLSKPFNSCNNTSTDLSTSPTSCFWMVPGTCHIIEELLWAVCFWAPFSDFCSPFLVTGPALVVFVAFCLLVCSRLAEAKSSFWGGTSLRGLKMNSPWY